MNRPTVLVVYLLAGTVLQGLWSTAPAKEPNPPAGFRGIFNGKDLTGWYWRNLFVHEIKAEEAKALLDAAEVQARSKLSRGSPCTRRSIRGLMPIFRAATRSVMSNKYKCWFPPNRTRK